MKSPELGYYGFTVRMLLKGDGWGDARELDK